MKYLLLIVVVALVLAWMSASRRRDVGDRTKKAPGRHGEPAKMLACTHCGVHLPQPEALFDAAGRPYCSEAHRLAGPR